MIVTVKVTVEPQCTDKQPHDTGEIVNVTCDATREPTEKQPREGGCTEKQPHDPGKGVILTFDATREPTDKHPREGSGETDESEDGGWAFIDGVEDQVKGKKRYYVIIFCKQAPEIIGFYHCIWAQLANHLPGGSLFHSGAKLKGFDNAEDAAKHFALVRGNSSTAARDGAGFEPVWFSKPS